MKFAMHMAGLVALAAPGLTAPALAAQAETPIEVSQTHRIPLSAKGTVTVDGTWGEVDVEAWDRPEVSVVMTTRTKSNYSGSEAAEARGKLERFTFAASAASPDQVVITGISPKASVFKPFGGKSGVSIHWDIKVPRTSNLVLDHGVGEVVIGGVAGNIDVSNDTGSIELKVPLDPTVAVETSSRIGDAELGSALLARGEYKRRALVGHSFSYRPSDARRHVIARVGIGSVEID